MPSHISTKMTKLQDASRRRTLGGPDNNLVRTKPLEDGISNDPFEGLVLALEEENKGGGAIPRLAFRFLIG